MLLIEGNEALVQIDGSDVNFARKQSIPFPFYFSIC